MSVPPPCSSDCFAAFVTSCLTISACSALFDPGDVAGVSAGVTPADGAGNGLRLGLADAANICRSVMVGIAAIGAAVLGPVGIDSTNR